MYDAFGIFFVIKVKFQNFEFCDFLCDFWVVCLLFHYGWLMVSLSILFLYGTVFGIYFGIYFWYLFWYLLLVFIVVCIVHSILHKAVIVIVGQF